MNHKRVSQRKKSSKTKGNLKQAIANLQNLTGGTRSAKYGGRAAKKARGKRRPALPKYNKKKK